MKIKIKTRILTLISIFLLLTTTVMLVSLPLVHAEEYQTIAYLSVNPNPIGVDQTLLVNMWLTPSIPSGPAYHDFTVTFTKPDGTKDVITLDSEPWGTAANWFEYTPDQVGTWTVQFVYPGEVFEPQDVPGYMGGYSLWEGGTYKGDTTPELKLVVQEDPVLGVPENELPTGYWERPIYEENKEWGAIAGDWVQSGADAGTTRFNPYSQGPESAHILMTQEIEFGGIIGGYYGGLTYGGGSSTPLGRTNIIFYGRTIYRDQDGATHCIDIKTGEEYWVNPTMASITGVVYHQTRLQPLEFKPYLVSIGTTYKKYDPWTGTEVYSLDGALRGTLDGSTSNPSVYSVSGGRLIKWATSERQIISVLSMSQPARTFDELIEYNVTAPDFSISYISGRYGGSINNYPAVSGCVDLETGETLWSRVIPIEERRTGAICAGDGKIFTSGDGAKVRAYDVRTGNRLWEAEADYPWGTFWSYSGLSYAYGNVYASNYDGLYCFDGETGQREWVFKTPNSGYMSPYPGWAFWGGAVIADGKVYQSTGEHSPSNPVPVGNRIYCVDAFSGEMIWSLSDLSGATSADPKTIADGVLLFCNEYNLKMYAIGIGKSATTVTAPDVAVPKGTAMTIRGTLLDLSPAQPNTPCVSKESMATQMEYLHMQKPIDGIWHDQVITGVPVTLTAISENGECIDIGTTTTNGYYGTFGISWTPQNEGTYEIVASFEGDESYDRSAASTYVTVGPATSASSGIQQETSIISTEVAIIIAVVAVAAIGAVAYVFGKKRK